MSPAAELGRQVTTEAFVKLIFVGLASLVVGAIGALAALWCTFVFFGRVIPCPASGTCDLGWNGGFALGLAIGPLTGIVLTWLTFRALKRALRQQRAQTI